MNKKNLLRRITQKLEKIRIDLNVSDGNMADQTGVSRTSYARYLKGEMVPGALTLAKFSRAFGISLDWLLLDKGPMYLKEKLQELSSHFETENPNLMEINDEDTRKLVSEMALDPRFRHEMLLYFYNYKERAPGKEDG
jgi:transcriptional regulator with XRE-family HTH domain